MNHIGKVVNVLHNTHALDDARLQRIREVDNRRKCISRGGVDANVHTHARRLLELIIAHKRGQIVPHRGASVATVGHRGGFGWVGYLQQTNALVHIVYFPLGGGDPVFYFLQTHFGAHRGVVAAPSQRSVSVSRAKTQQLVAHVVDLRFDGVAPVLCFVVRVGGQHQTTFFGFSGAHCRRCATSCGPHAYHHHACKKAHTSGEGTDHHSADGHRGDLAAGQTLVVLFVLLLAFLLVTIFAFYRRVIVFFVIVIDFPSDPEGELLSLFIRIFSNGGNGACGLQRKGSLGFLLTKSERKT